MLGLEPGVVVLVGSLLVGTLWQLRTWEPLPAVDSASSTDRGVSGLNLEEGGGSLAQDPAEDKVL